MNSLSIFRRRLDAAENELRRHQVDEKVRNMTDDELLAFLDGPDDRILWSRIPDCELEVLASRNTSAKVRDKILSKYKKRRVADGTKGDEATE
jgi:hypothetical protein